MKEGLPVEVILKLQDERSLLERQQRAGIMVLQAEGTKTMRAKVKVWGDAPFKNSSSRKDSV